MKRFPAHLVLTAIAAICLLSFNMTADATENGGVRHVNPAGAQKLIDQKPEIVILDIRTPEEFRQGHIAGAVNIDYFAPDFGDRVAGLDPDASYLVHCKSGGRSMNALPLFKNAGLKNVTHLDQGFDGWRALGLEIVND